MTLVGLLALFALLGCFWIAGSANVIDRTRGVETAVVTSNGGYEQKLYRVWPGRFYAIPDMEGTIEVRCTNGVRKQRGYVTGYMHSTVTVVGETPCATLIAG